MVGTPLRSYSSSSSLASSSSSRSPTPMLGSSSPPKPSNRSSIGPQAVDGEAMAASRIFKSRSTI
ncbi:hypothetical protein HAX54_012242, partial [Datura stramonium]|nr:hypothetical protein [Datura stramonium]